MRKLLDHVKSCQVEEVFTAPAGQGPAVEEPVPGKSVDRVKRRAATKAQGRVAEFVRQMKTKFEGESSEAEVDEDISDDSDDNYDVKNEAELSSLYKAVMINKR